MSEELQKSATIQSNDIRLIIPLFLLKKLKLHPLTLGLYPVSLGKSQHSHYQIKQTTNKQHSLIYCHSGNGTLDYKSRVREIKRGDLVIISPDHDYNFQTIYDVKNLNQNVNHSTNTNAIYWINFEGSLAIDFAMRLLMKMDDGLAHVGIISSVLADFDGILALGSRGYTATNVIHAVHVLQQALSNLALQLRLSTFNNSSKFNIEDVEALMRNNLHQELSLETLAHYSQLSIFHFSKKFKELTDTSPIQHFINMKIQRACLQLDNSNETIKYIAENLGYNDPYYFSRLFKKVTGMSPKQYRDSGHK
ncbi:MAG: AraC family transcriptional regulator of arabinose operon [Alteromonadaceae bacterium]|jgi:AraC family transcriptional regulator of arabinose operon